MQISETTAKSFAADTDCHTRKNDMALTRIDNQGLGMSLKHYKSDQHE
jgi:hypothetical protein